VIRLAFKGLLARKLRTVLTGFAVVLGVAFVAGTFIFTDTIDASFKDLFERTSKGTDVSVQSKLAVEADFAAPPTMPGGTLKRVQSVDGVDEAAGTVSGDVNLLDRKGKPILSNGPPTIAVTTTPERFDPLTYVEGDKPANDGQIAIDKGTADEFGYKVGDKVTVAGRAPAKAYDVSGIATLGDSENLAGSRLVLFTLDEGRKVTGHDGYDDISVAASGGTTPEAL
jgi:putative ABC transport system permease protein